MKCHILHLITSSQHVNLYAPFNDCAVTHAWVNRHSHQRLSDANRVIRFWLTPMQGWESNVDYHRSNSRRTPKSVAMF